jgi:hypothetical protein
LLLALDLFKISVKNETLANSAKILTRVASEPRASIYNNASLSYRNRIGLMQDMEYRPKL